MNKRLLILAVLSVLPGIAAAQGNFDSELDSQLAQLSNPQVPQSTQGAPAAAAIAPQGTQNGQPIYILNQATPTSSAQVQQTSAQTAGQAQAQPVQVQPQVDVVASPLTKSRAEQIREARQQAEVETENKIVEKLEAARMEDERRRSSVLFGDTMNQNNINAQNVQVQQQQVQAVQAVAPVAAAPAVEAPKENTRDIVREELQAALKAEQPAEEAGTEQKYFSALLGVGEYPDIVNVRGNYLVGANFGTKFDDTYAVEGGFTYGDYSVEPVGPGFYGPLYMPRLIDVRQFSGSLAVKYFFLNGAIKPVLGGVAQYSYRTYQWNNDGIGGYANTASANSHAIDLGIVTGAEIDFNKKWSLGLDVRYYWNMSSRVNTDNQSGFLTRSDVFGKPLEKLQYYTMGVVARANF